MPLGDESVLVPVILPREYLPLLDARRSPTLRSRSAVVRRIVEAALAGSFLLPTCSVDDPIGSPTNHKDAA